MAHGWFSKYERKSLTCMLARGWKEKSSLHLVVVCLPCMSLEEKWLARDQLMRAAVLDHVKNIGRFIT